MFGKEKDVKSIDIVDDVPVDMRKVSWFVGKMFNPEDNIWVWIRRIANVITFPILIILIMLFFRGG